MSWLRHFGREVLRTPVELSRVFLPDSPMPSESVWPRRLGLLSMTVLLTSGFALSHREVQRNPPRPVTVLAQDPGALDPALLLPVREIPDRFPARHRKPTLREVNASGSLSDASFIADFDLIPVEDDRVWWESDNDEASGDTENDHLMHQAMVLPFRRLVELVHERGATLKVQDTYRATGVHHRNSLHKHGRAIDLTAEGMSLSELAKCTWASGFDWVFYEAPKNGGAHIHASVRARPKEVYAALPPEDE